MASCVKINSKWVAKKYVRLDAKYYAGDGQKEARRYELNNIPKRNLKELTKGGTSGIFIPARFKRNFVENEVVGYPYIKGSEISKIEPLIDCSFLSRKYTKNVNRLIFKPKSTIITCSGAIGNTLYVTDSLDNVIGTPDLLRVIPDFKKIHPGYLYAFLSSKIGKALVTQHTYGSVVQHIEAHHLYDLPVPILSESLMKKVHQLIEESGRLRNEANLASKEVSKKTVSKLPKISDKIRQFECSRIKINKINFSFAAYNNSEDLGSIIMNIKSSKNFLLKDITPNIFSPALFKHIYITKDNGYPFLTGGELEQEKPLRKRFLSPLGVKNINDYVVRKNWLVVYKSGSIDGMIGKPFLIGEDLDGFCLSDHVIRIKPEEGKEKYLLWAFAFMRSHIGKKLVKRMATGTAIPFILPERLGELTIPFPHLEDDLNYISETITRISHIKCLANKLETKAISMVEEELN